MTRWMHGYRQSPPIRWVAPVIPFNLVTASPDDPDFIWPSLSDIRYVQNEYISESPKNPNRTEGPPIRIKGAWVTDSAVDMKRRLLIIAYAGSADHRGSDTTCHTVRKQLASTDQRDDVRNFVSSCLLFLLSKSGNKIRHPLSTTLHASKPNQVLQFDYLFMGQSDEDDKYVLAVKDDLTGYCWLEPSSSADSEHSAEVMSRWTRVFTAPDVWVSDKGSHFKNEVLKQLASIYCIRHNLIVAYSSMANGTVEALMRPILPSTRSLFSELKLDPQDWASVIPKIASALNKSPLDCNGHHTDGTERC